MWEILANLLLPQALKSCPKSNKSPNLVTLVPSQEDLEDCRWKINVEDHLKLASGQSYKHFMLVTYDSRVVIRGIFQSGTTLEL